MLSKLLYRIPKPYQLLLIGTASALVAISVGLFANYLLPAPPKVSPQLGDRPQIMASGVSITQIPSNPAPSAQTMPTADAASPSPISAAAILQDNGSAVTGATQQPIAPSSSYAEPYDDLPATQHNHLPYDQADQTRVVSVGSFTRESYEREEFLDVDAAQAFKTMSNAAAAEGISLIPISGFRTINQQAELFTKQVEKLGSESEAAKISAPPGHSEHHTGFAIDIGDANHPEADITYEFETTDAYQWLLANAGTYGFELSFPKDNQQGVSFEPWHWRYIASPEAAQTFFR